MQEEQRIIKNYESLATSPKRNIVLSLIEEAFRSIEPRHVMDKNFVLTGETLHIAETSVDLTTYKRIFLVGLGKGSSGIAEIIEQKLGEKLTEGFDIDVVDHTFQNIAYTKGTHPLPSATNIAYTKNVLERIHNLAEDDLVLVVICGGGSVLFETPASISLEQLTAVNTALLRSGATISEMNVIRKHLSLVKGGGLAKHLYPARVVSLIFSDVPGNDLSVIASAPTVKDPSTLDDVSSILKKYSLTESAGISEKDFVETPQEEKYFENVQNILILSNKTALLAMAQKAKTLGIGPIIHADNMQGDAKTIGQSLLTLGEKGKVVLIGGETTVKVTGSGKGGRNQTLVLASLPFIDQNTIIASFDSDGWDFYELAGAIGDAMTNEKAKKLHLDIPSLLANDDSYAFFSKTGDGIITDKRESNVSDLIIVYKT